MDLNINSPLSAPQFKGTEPNKPPTEETNVNAGGHTVSTKTSPPAESEAAVVSDLASNAMSNPPDSRALEQAKPLDSSSVVALDDLPAEENTQTEENGEISKDKGAIQPNPKSSTEARKDEFTKGVIDILSGPTDENSSNVNAPRSHAEIDAGFTLVAADKRATKALDTNKSFLRATASKIKYKFKSLGHSLNKLNPKASDTLTKLDKTMAKQHPKTVLNDIIEGFSKGKADLDKSKLALGYINKLNTTLHPELKPLVRSAIEALHSSSENLAGADALKTDIKNAMTKILSYERAETLQEIVNNLAPEDFERKIAEEELKKPERQKALSEKKTMPQENSVLSKFRSAISKGIVKTAGQVISQLKKQIENTQNETKLKSIKLTLGTMTKILSSEKLEGKHEELKKLLANSVVDVNHKLGISNTPDDPESEVK